MKHATYTSLSALLMLGVLLGISALSGCAKENTVTANSSLDCGDDAVRCVPCEPDALDCDGANLIECTPDGVGFSLKEACDSPQLCVDGLNGGACAPPLCVEGDVQCVGAIMQICAPGRHRYDLLACPSEDACLRGLSGRACALVECSSANDCTGEDTQCRRRVCVEGACQVENLPQSTACTIADVNGVCDGNGGCRATDQCTVAGDCTGEDTECRIRACVQGACGFVDIPEGTACETTSVAGACNGEGACLPTAECTIASDCAGEDTECRIRACVQGACGFVDIPAGTACETADVTGACSGEGACLPTVDCALASDCPGEDTQCRVRACVDGACGFANLPDGETCQVEGLNGMCAAGICAAESQCAVASDCGGTDTDCRSRTCDGGVCGFSNATSGAPCSSGGLQGVCDGGGGCTITQQCTTASDCPADPDPCRTAICTGSGRCSFDTASGGTPCTLGTLVGVCDGGQCRCASGTRLCDGRCVNVDDDVDHCGRCNDRCDTAIGEVCADGDCECPGGSDGGVCGGQCVSLLTTSHCGDCATSCGDNAFCDASRSNAVCACVNGYVDCGNGFCEVSNSNENCGECGRRCPAGTQCNADGECVCDPAPGVTTPAFCEPGQGCFRERDEGSCVDLFREPTQCNEGQSYWVCLNGFSCSENPNACFSN